MTYCCIMTPNSLSNARGQDVRSHIKHNFNCGFYIESLGDTTSVKCSLIIRLNDRNLFNLFRFITLTSIYEILPQIRRRTLSWSHLLAEFISNAEIIRLTQKLVLASIYLLSFCFACSLLPWALSLVKWAVVLRT